MTRTALPGGTAHNLPGSRETALHCDWVFEYCVLRLHCSVLHCVLNPGEHLALQTDEEGADLHSLHRHRNLTPIISLVLCRLDYHHGSCRVSVE